MKGGPEPHLSTGTFFTVMPGAIGPNLSMLIPLVAKNCYLCTMSVAKAETKPFSCLAYSASRCQELSYIGFKVTSTPYIYVANLSHYCCEVVVVVSHILPSDTYYAHTDYAVTDYAGRDAIAVLSSTSGYIPNQSASVGSSSCFGAERVFSVHPFLTR